MTSAFGIEHEIAKYQRHASGDSVKPEHKQVEFKNYQGRTQNVDRKLKRTVTAMNKAGIQTKYSDQGRPQLRRSPERDAYIYFNDPEDKHLKGLPTKRFTRDVLPANRYNRKAGASIEFRRGPRNRARIRREVKQEVGKSFKKIHPKLVNAEMGSLERIPNGRLSSMDDRLKENYAQWRSLAGSGNHDRRTSETRRELKTGARAMVTAAGKRSKRKGRTLP